MELDISSTRLAATEENDSENLVRCDRCESLVPETYTVITSAHAWHGHREEWCASCVDDEAIKCEDCGNYYVSYFVDEYWVYGGDTRNLCSDCRYDNYYRCEECDDLVPNDEVCWGDDDQPYCPNCVERHCRGENVSCYEHTDGETFWLDDGTPVDSWRLTPEQRRMLYFGIELETDDNDNVNALADDLMNEFGYSRLVCKEDGSLSSDGLEIVSQPMTPLYHLNSGMWRRISEIVLAHGGKSHDAGNCGLHIHGSRDFFKDHDAVYRLDRLFHRFKDELVNFSRRTDFSYCHLYDDDLHEIEDVEERKATWKEKKVYEGRYVAINDSNTDTVEFRLWRGTLNVETIRATIEMTAALAIVANSMSDELADSLTWPMLKLLVRYALDANGIPRNDLDTYLSRRSL